MKDGVVYNENNVKESVLFILVESSFYFYYLLTLNSASRASCSISRSSASFVRSALDLSITSLACISMSMAATLESSSASELFATRTRPSVVFCAVGTAELFLVADDVAGAIVAPAVALAEVSL